MKKPTHLDLREWQDFLYRFKTEADKVKSPNLPVAMRIENTQLTIARYYGRTMYNGHVYTYFEPKIPNHEPNPDGSPYVAWLLVRHDFLMWVSKEIKKQAKVKGYDNAKNQQGCLKL